MQLAISASQVLPGPAGHRFDRGAVLLEDSSIVAVGSRDDIRAAAPDATELAYPDATIIPGLINVHVHLAFDPGPHRLERLTDNREAAEIALAMAGHAP
jgi:imidazolonepropionase-like amidohydrolase